MATSQAIPSGFPNARSGAGGRHPCRLGFHWFCPHFPSSPPRPSISGEPFRSTGTSAEVPSTRLGALFLQPVCAFRHIQNNRYTEAEAIITSNAYLVHLVDEFGNTLLTIASQNNRKRFVKLFLRHGVHFIPSHHHSYEPLCRHSPCLARRISMRRMGKGMHHYTIARHTTSQR